MKTRPTALISGITGQDGSFLAEQLLGRGYRVVGLHRRLSSVNHWRISHIEGLELACVDLLDLSSLLDVVRNVKPDEIYNLAAQSFVPASWSQPTLTGDVTGLGAVRMLEAYRREAPDAKFYQASSSEMFGQALSSPQNEKTPFTPLSPYACSKVYAHHMAVNYRKAYGLFISCGTLFNHESERRGLEFVTRKITAAAARISKGLQDTLVLGDLSPRRDWGFAGDYTRAMQAMLGATEPDDFVVASGTDYSVEDFVAASFDSLNLDWRNHVVSDERFYRKNELSCLTGDSAYARSKLGWCPEVSFEGLVERMIEADVERAEAEKRYGLNFQ